MSGFGILGFNGLWRTRFGETSFKSLFELEEAFASLSCLTPPFERREGPLDVEFINTLYPARP